jgi:hypothetical protein
MYVAPFLVLQGNKYSKYGFLKLPLSLDYTATRFHEMAKATMSLL